MNTDSFPIEENGLFSLTPEIKALVDGTFDYENMRIYFWRGVFSQWHKAPIHDPFLHITGNCAEQLMMAYKAAVFEDFDSMRKIMETLNARKQKEIGRAVKGYDDAVWKAKRFEVVTHISELKFFQNAQLKEVMVATQDFELVEASPEDEIWGIGIAENHPDIKDKSKWPGLNLLGKALMEARKAILTTV